MAQYQAIAELTLDFSLAGAVEKSQMWVLSAMKDLGPSLVHLLWRILGNEADVCDAYQETFLRLAHLPDQKKPHNIRSYLYQTATNIALTDLRKKQTHKKALSHLADNQSNPSQSSDPGMELDTQELCQRLRSAMVHLPDYLSDVIALHDLAELSYQEVAEILGIRVTTVRVYRHKALMLLASCLDRNNKNEVCL